MSSKTNRPAPTEFPERGQVYNVSSGRTTTTGTEIWPGRPAVVISNDAINRKAGFVTVVYLTTARKRDMPYHARVSCDGKDATVLCEQIFSVDKSRLEFYVDTLSDGDMEAVDRAVMLSTATIGGSKQSCVSLFRKWLLSMEKHGIDISGNPAEERPTTAEAVASAARELGLSEGMVRVLERCARGNGDGTA